MFKRVMKASTTAEEITLPVGFFFLWCLLLLFPHEPPGHLTLFLARAHWHASISIQKMNVFFFQKFPGVLKGRIWFLLGFGWEEKVKKKKIQSGKKSKNLFFLWRNIKGVQRTMFIYISKWKWILHGRSYFKGHFSAPLEWFSCSLDNIMLLD